MVAPGRFLLGHFYWAKTSNLFSSCSWDKIIFLKTLVSYQLNAESFWVQELLFMLEVRVKENIPVYLAQNKSKSLKKPEAALTKCCRKWVCGGESAWLQRRMFSIPVDSNHFNSIVSWSRDGSMWFCPFQRNTEISSRSTKPNELHLEQSCDVTTRGHGLFKTWKHTLTCSFNTRDKWIKREVLRRDKQIKSGLKKTEDNHQEPDSFRPKRAKQNILRVSAQSTVCLDPNLFDCRRNPEEGIWSSDGTGWCWAFGVRSQNLRIILEKKSDISEFKKFKNSEISRSI